MGISKKILGAGFMTGVGNVMNVVGGVASYNEARKEGDGRAVAVTKAVADFALYEMLGGAAIPFALAGAGASIMASSFEANAETMKRQASTLGSGRVGAGYFNMSEAGYTMRQRSLNKIRNNGQQINSILGSEARTYARSVDI